VSLPSLLRLFLLSAIWGASFPFMRVGVTALSPAQLIFWCVGLASLFLSVGALLLRRGLQLRGNLRHYFVLGFFNCVLPFMLYAYAARVAPAALLAVLNATAPMWATAIAAVLTQQGIRGKTALGLLLGIAGVSLLAGIETTHIPAGGGLAVLAGLGSAFCYGIATHYSRHARDIEPYANAHGCLWAATLTLAPLFFWDPIPAQAPAETVWLAVIGLGILCSGVAYLLYFRLVADIGPASALTVTFLVPVFGILWGYLFLDEAIGWHTAAGCMLVLMGTAWVTGFTWAPLRKT